MYRYKRDKEIRFKITDQEDEMLQELAYQLYKIGIINKPNIRRRAQSHSLLLSQACQDSRRG
jgi:hypothetical protein